MGWLRMVAVAVDAARCDTWRVLPLSERGPGLQHKFSRAVAAILLQRRDMSIKVSVHSVCFRTTSVCECTRFLILFLIFIDRYGSGGLDRADWFLVNGDPVSRP